MIFEKDKGLSQIKFDLAFSFSLLLLFEIGLFWICTVKSFFPTETGFSYKSRDLGSHRCFQEFMLPKVSKQTQPILQQCFRLEESCYLTRCYYREEKQITLYIFGSTETFHKVVIPKEIQKFICQKTLWLNRVKHQLCPCPAL